MLEWFKVWNRFILLLYLYVTHAFLPLEVVQRELICFQSLPVSFQNILVFPTFLRTLLKHTVTLWEQIVMNTDCTLREKTSSIKISLYTLRVELTLGEQSTSLWEHSCTLWEQTSTLWEQTVRFENIAVHFENKLVHFKNKL